MTGHSKYCLLAVFALPDNEPSTPALVLLDTARQIAWKQDEGLRDESPLNLEQVEARIER